jgi:hypothetical protein
MIICPFLFLPRFQIIGSEDIDPFHHQTGVWNPGFV